MFYQHTRILTWCSKNFTMFLLYFRHQICYFFNSISEIFNLLKKLSQVTFIICGDSGLIGKDSTLLYSN